MVDSCQRELGNEPGVIVGQQVVGVFNTSLNLRCVYCWLQAPDGGGRAVPGTPSRELAECPIGVRPECREPRGVWGPRPQGGQES